MATASGEGLVIRALDYSNTSQILLLLTQDGPVSLLAKGSRRPTNNFQGPIDHMSLISAEWTPPKEPDGIGALRKARQIWWPVRARLHLRTWLAMEVIREAALGMPAGIGLLDWAKSALVRNERGAETPAAIAMWALAGLQQLEGTVPDLSKDGPKGAWLDLRDRVTNRGRPNFDDGTPWMGRRWRWVPADLLAVLRMAYRGRMPPKESDPRLIAAALRLVGLLVSFDQGRQIRSTKILADETAASALIAPRPA